MALRSWATVIGFGLLATVVACNAPSLGEAQGGTESAISQKPFDKNDVLDDKWMIDSAAMSADDVQAFLEKNPWGTRSVLASYTEDGRTASEILTTAAQKYSINPLALLVRAQMEQSLVYKTTASKETIAIALGCGCPHSPLCNDSYRGLANQAECAAGTLSRAMAAAQNSSGTVSGWAKGTSKDTEDGITVTPKNATTAALYTYTPWVGEAGGGKTGVGGASLHFEIWASFAATIHYGAWQNLTTDATTDDGVVADGGADSGQLHATDAGGATSTTPADDADAGADQSPGDDPSDPGADPSDPSDPNDPGADPSDPSDPGDPSADPSDPSDPGSDPSDPGTETKPDAGSDAGPAKNQPGPSGNAGAPSDGSQDGNIVGAGNTTPSDDTAPVPHPTSKAPKAPSPGDYPTASDSDLASKSSEGGCSTSPTGASGIGGEALLIAAALVISRRRKRA